MTLDVLNIPKNKIIFDILGLFCLSVIITMSYIAIHMIIFSSDITLIIISSLVLFVSGSSGYMILHKLEEGKVIQIIFRILNKINN